MVVVQLKLARYVIEKWKHLARVYLNISTIIHIDQFLVSLLQSTDITATKRFRDVAVYG